MSGNIIGRVRHILVRDTRDNVERMTQPQAFMVYGVYLGNPISEWFDSENDARRYVMDLERADRKFGAIELEIARLDGILVDQVDWDSSQFDLMERGWG